MALRFVPYHDLGDIPNVVVDGSPTDSTRLTLSHWPGSPTPIDLRDDLSAQIALRALATPQRLVGLEAVSNNHFDQDGLTSAYALLEPDAALARRELVVDIARAGDFATFASRDAARLSMAIGAFADPDRSPLDRAVFGGQYPDQCGALYLELLPRLTALLDDPASSRALWAAEDAHLAAGLAAVADGTVTIRERPDIDLAVVTVPTGWHPHPTHRFAHQFARGWTEAVHPMAINNATDMLRILLVQGARARLELRYESWVMLTSRPVMPRPDLRALAAHLTALEPRDTTWTADRPGALTPYLGLADPDGESGLEPDRLVSEISSFLAGAAPAWDPFEGAEPLP